MQRSLRGLALRGAFGALVIGAGLMGAPAFAASGNGHEGHTPTLNGHAKLVHTPTGTASLVWDKTKGLTANLSLTGLTPGGSYTANIEQGSCKKGGTALNPVMTTSITPDATGKGTGQIAGAMPNGIPHKGWFVAVSQGSTMVACGNVRDMHHEGDKGHKGHEGHLSHKGQQTQQTQQSDTEHASAKLGSTEAANQDVDGHAHLQLKNGTLTMTVHAHGLTEGAKYPVTLTQGSCSALSTTPVYSGAINPLAQNAEGDWISTTTGTSTGLTAIPDGKWYVGIWSTDGKDLLACGNVKVSDHGNKD